MLPTDISTADIITTALESVGDGVWLFDVKTYRPQYSDKVRQMLGYNNDELPDSIESWRQIIHPADAQLAAEQFQYCIAGSSKNFYAEFRLKTKDGSYKWILSRGSVFERDENGEALRIIGTYADVSETKRLKKELENNRNLMHGAFRYSAIGMALVALDGRMIEVNDAFVNLLGYSKEELLQMSFNDFTHDDDKAQSNAFVDKLIHGEIRSFTIEKRYIAKDKRVVWTEVTGTLIRKQDGTPNYFVSQLVDVTAKKLLREELLIQNHRLHNAVENLNQKLKQIEQFNYMVTHNLRGPINNIQALYTLADIADDTTEYDILIRASFDVLQKSLDNLLAANIIHGTGDIEITDCHFATIFEKAAVQCNLKQTDANITVDFQVDHLRYSPQYLESIFYNFISNAVKYKHPSRKLNLEVRTFRKNACILLSVKDNGLGMDLGKVGDQLFKLNKTFHAGYDSKGVGLFLTKTQIESLGGSVSVNSKENEGSEFLVNLTCNHK